MIHTLYANLDMCSVWISARQCVCERTAYAVACCRSRFLSPALSLSLSLSFSFPFSFAFGLSLSVSLFLVLFLSPIVFLHLSQPPQSWISLVRALFLSFSLPMYTHTCWCGSNSPTSTFCEGKSKKKMDMLKKKTPSF